MSSLVQQKCTSSETAGSTVSAPSTPGAASRCSLRKYSTALTSWTVTFSMAPSRATASASKDVTTERR
jgi:hypothetical protein